MISKIETKAKSPLGTCSVTGNSERNKENRVENQSPTISRKRRLFASLSLDQENRNPNLEAIATTPITTCFSKRFPTLSVKENDDKKASPNLDQYFTVEHWFSIVKSAFHRSSCPSFSSIIKVRNDEYKYFESFWNKSLFKNEPLEQRNASIFITGPPGCGKSAFVDTFLQMKQA